MSRVCDVFPCVRLCLKIPFQGIVHNQIHHPADQGRHIRRGLHSNRLSRRRRTRDRRALNAALPRRIWDIFPGG